MSRTRKTWERAQQVIPTGGQLFSKRPEVHLPHGWPAHFSRAEGCHVWDLDGNRYVDAGLMGVGTNILGFAHPSVDEAVMQVVRSGNMSTLNPPEEVDLAELLIDLHPWADSARFTRAGGEACAVAVRLARAASGKDGVAFCGYHGWHDWYLAANLEGTSKLSPHLLEGLTPLGVPKALRGTAVPFTYNEIESLSSIMARGNIGTVIMEVQRNQEPLPGFLQSVRSLCHDQGAVLIFDECTSGFRREVSGLHAQYEITPDLAVFGKTLGNGYAIAAVIGRASVMDYAKRTFISSTFWTERLGPAAGVRSLTSMIEEEAPQQIHKIGLKVRSAWEEIAVRSGVAIELLGVPALSSFVTTSHDPLAAKTFITESMLSKGFLSGTSFYACTAHTDGIVDHYLTSLEGVLTRLGSMDDKALKLALPHGTAQAHFRKMVSVPVASDQASGIER